MVEKKTNVLQILKFATWYSKPFVRMIESGDFLLMYE